MYAPKLPNTSKIYSFFNINIHSPGDPCSTNSDCFYYSEYNLGCSSGICSHQAVGSACDDDVICGSTNYCSYEDNVCHATLILGDACDGNSTDAICGNLALCANSVCTKVFSKALNAPCTEEAECVLPLYCSVCTFSLYITHFSRQLKEFVLNELHQFLALQTNSAD